MFRLCFFFNSKVKNHNFFSFLCSGESLYSMNTFGVFFLNDRNCTYIGVLHLQVGICIENGKVIMRVSDADKTFLFSQYIHATFLCHFILYFRFLPFALFHPLREILKAYFPPRHIFIYRKSILKILQSVCTKSYIHVAQLCTSKLIDVTSFSPNSCHHITSNSSTALFVTRPGDCGAMKMNVNSQNM